MTVSDSASKMSFFTAEDNRNLKRLIDHQKVIYRRNVLLSKAPHIGTHTALRVKSCTDEYVYEDPVVLPPINEDQQKARRDLREIAIVTDWTFTSTGCDHVVSCNPFYPESKECNGMTKYTKEGDLVTQQSMDTETTFSFRTFDGRTFDACQPICYDSSVRIDNMVGLMTRYTFDKCRVYDPLVLAFYVDPTRRFVNPETQILERKAFSVRDVIIEPYGDAAILASIPTDYCDQYAETYRPDGSEQKIDMYKCSDHSLVWSTSWLIGESLPKLALLAYDKTAHERSDVSEERHPPTRSFLASKAAWLKNTVPGKFRLPFPLRLSDLGIKRGTNTEWLVWTDEFSHLTDGRNDRYGGRLVERDRPISRAVGSSSGRTVNAAAEAAIVQKLTAGGRFGFTHPSTGERRRRHKRQADSIVSDTEGTVVTGHGGTLDRVQMEMLKSMHHGAAESIRILNDELEHDELNLYGLGAGVAYAVAYEYISHELRLPTTVAVLKSAFTALRDAPSYAKRAALKTVGFWAAKSVSEHVVESTVTRCLVNRLKTLTAVQTLGPLAVVIDVISLVGMAIDITFVLLNAFGVSTPLSRRQNFVSDRRLYHLAKAEIEFNYRLYGVGNIELTPFQFVVNTPYLSPDEDVQSYMNIMPIVYSARELNSTGGLLKPDQIRDGEFEIAEDGTVRYLRNGEHHATVSDDHHIFSSTQEMLGSFKIRTGARDRSEQDTSTRHTADLTRFYVTTVLFISTFVIAFLYPSKHWTIAVALLVSVISVLVPVDPGAKKTTSPIPEKPTQQTG